MKQEIVRTCPSCKKELTLDQLVNDPSIQPADMSIDTDDIENAYYYFRHKTEKCGTAFMVNVLAFAPCITETIPKERLTLTDPCERHCVNLIDLQECKQSCFFAPFRRFLIKMIELKGRAKSVEAASNT